MIPVYEDLLLYDEEQIEEVAMPNKTFRLDEKRNVITGMIDDLDAIKQALKQRLQVEMEEFEIYSQSYGINLADKLGKPIQYLLPHIEMAIEEAILNDDRIMEVQNMETTQSGKNAVLVTFDVVTDLGTVKMAEEVTI